MDIVIVTGFLGGGKTSTLNYLIQDALDRDLKPAVIINEFGAKNVDAQLVTEDVKMALLTNGCICCDLKADVSQQLHELYLAHQPDIVLIECSGAAHPVEVFDACMTPVLAPYIQDLKMLGIIDAAAYDSRDALPETIQNLMDEQIRYCSHLIVNKIDLMESEQLLAVVQTLQQQYPDIPYILTRYGEITLQEIQSTAEYRISERTSVHHHGHLSHLLYEFESPIQQSALIEGLKRLKGVYRIKGFVYFKDYETPYVVQYLPGQLELKPCPIEMSPYLVVVGHDLNEEDIIETLDIVEFSS
ncbi:CobW family GTP-binding protein [Staphylococcus intermedius]|uniref:Cobalamin synthesis protein n=1 Tax=Staphylococcus intermedius NCTC 11048 TaxID=1141106 RepID=A0A380G3Q4_STAIN|nr:GTP-binding protein [Staphylococcus intermedius]PCF63921.1 GTP-binding protein [Staphylococcus intermedius]PCF78636.1 GTP-binding protein [Staphylococcus intermedius]PCF79609.1 GTP-binding protein [Staphylococcus intermedius]PCF86655.1 GTP-binding protein [Staphylococcus intermedius]PCF89732.1 GTP-binding protein [Staphylococcus intermedius]